MGALVLLLACVQSGNVWSFAAWVLLLACCVCCCWPYLSLGSSCCRVVLLLLLLCTAAADYGGCCWCWYACGAVAVAAGPCALPCTTLAWTLWDDGAFFDAAVAKKEKLGVTPNHTS